MSKNTLCIKWVQRRQLDLESTDNKSVAKLWIFLITPNLQQVGSEPFHWRYNSIFIFWSAESVFPGSSEHNAVRHTGEAVWTWTVSEEQLQENTAV